jgi:hypothetical protein
MISFLTLMAGYRPELMAFFPPVGLAESAFQEMARIALHTAQLMCDMAITWLSEIRHSLLVQERNRINACIHYLKIEKRIIIYKEKE